MRRSHSWSLALAAVAVSPVAFAQSKADQPVDYTVRKGDTCYGIAQRHYGDSRFIDLIHEANAGMGPAPHALKEGAVLKLPAKPKGQGPDANLDFVRNKVEVQAPAPKPGKPNDPLFRGNKVSTKEQSSAEVRFARDNSQVRLGEHTLVVILGDSKGAASRVGETTLVSGSLRARLGELEGKKSNEQVFTTPGAKVKIGQGEVQLSVDKKQTSRVAVYKGASTLTAQNKTVSIPENHGSKAELGKAPTPPAPLPSAPAWSKAPPALVLADTAAVSFSGEYAPGAQPPKVATFHVELAKDAMFRDPVLDARVGLATFRLEAQAVPPGVYYSRVSAIDEDLFEGRPGPVAETRVVPFALTRAGDQVLVPAAPDLKCGVDGGPMEVRTQVLALDGRVAHQIRCATLAGAGEAASLTTPVVVAPAPYQRPRPERPKVAAAPEMPSEKSVIVAEFMVGARLTSSSLGEPGGSFAGGLGVRVPMKTGALGLGVRVGREEHLERSAFPRQFGGQEVKFTHGALVLDVPLSYHFNKPADRFSPYVVLAPSFLFQDGTFSLPTGEERESYATLFGLWGALGAELRLGPGNLFGELGYRGTTTRSFDFASTGMRGGFLNVGYRFLLK